MTRMLCGPLAAWAGAWLAGTAAFDDVLAAASIAAPAPELVMAAPRVPAMTGAPAAAAGQTSALGEILIAWRQSKARVRLVLPVPGDTRGVPGRGEFLAAALEASQAVVGAGRDGAVGAVPVLIDHRPSSAPPTLGWRRFDTEPPLEDLVSIADAQYELSEAIRECASTLARLDLSAAAATDDDIVDELGAARRAGERINLPPGFPPKAVALVAQAERMSAALALAGATRPAVPDSRSVALQPLVLAVRRARLAGYNAAA